MNKKSGKAVHNPGNTVAARLLSKLMQADHEVDDNENKLSELIEKRLGKRVPQPTIHRILSGESNEPRRSSIEPIAEYYGISAEMFYKEELEDNDIALAISSSESNRLTMLFHEADRRGRDTIMAIAQIESDREKSKDPFLGDSVFDVDAETKLSKKKK
ncbi:MAG: hypothetical protein ABW119_22580 [Candidatus Thiodiazotropha lotti]|nr:hypothetical protein [Candidatus Thiodiazotropha lotti]MCW4221935.1 hypothetical protein [Candidatus Thiodiazotropha lotti]